MPSAVARPPGRPAAALLLAAVLGACGPAPLVTPTPTASGPATSALPTSPSTTVPYASAAWPESGSACGIEGYTGRLGRIEAVTARTVRFELCRPDGAFPARLAHPSLGVVDAASVAMLEQDPSSARSLPGAGEFRVDAWTPGDNVRLERIGPAGGPAPATVILRWAASAADRERALGDAEVDVIDDPGAQELDRLATLPEVSVLPRPGLATAYLGFGTGARLSEARVRRGIAQGIDAETLARDAFPPGSTAARWLSPCELAGGCEGEPWYEFNGPAGTADLAAAGFDPAAPLTLHVPDAAVPGLPDPARVAAALRDQLAESLGVSLEIDVRPAAELAAAIADGTVGGLYLWGEASMLADPSGFLEPLVGPDAGGTAATRARAARKPLRAAAGTGDEAVRSAAFATANGVVRETVALVPLAHPGSTVAFRADVSRVATSPMGIDPLGIQVPGDRGQLVFMQAGEPAATWCAIAPDADSLRLCGLVTPGLYAFTGGRLVPEPSLASRCTPSEDATAWTCRLRPDARFGDGTRVDAGDVLASFRAQADGAGPLRAAFPPEAFAAWDALFGGPVPGAPAPGGPGPR